MRLSAKRLRHVPAVAAQTPTLAEISLLLRPAAAARTMRARSANACGAPCLRVSAVNSLFSPLSSTIATARPLDILASLRRGRENVNDLSIRTLASIEMRQGRGYRWSLQHAR